MDCLAVGLGGNKPLSIGVCTGLLLFEFSCGNHAD